MTTTKAEPRARAAAARAQRRASFLARHARAAAKASAQAVQAAPAPPVQEDRLLEVLGATRARPIREKAPKPPNMPPTPRWKMAKRIWDSTRGTLRHVYKTPNGAVIKSRKEYKRIRRELDELAR